MEKFIVRLIGDDSTAPVGLKYDDRPKRGILHVGGRASQRAVVEATLKYFGVDCVNPTSNVRVRWIQKYLIRFEVRTPRSRFLEGLEALRADCYSIVRVNRLRGISC